LKRFRELFFKKKEKYINVMATKTSGSAGMTKQLGGEYFWV
jgi:hypothetical protein